MRIFIFITIAAFFETASFCQWRGYQFDELGQEDGLYTRKVVAFTQDRSGLMYMATEMGLIRYDGKQFEYFIHDPMDTTSISSGELNDIITDSDGIVWLVTKSHLEAFNPINNSFTKYRLKQNPEISDDPTVVPRRLLDDGEFLWIGSTNAIHRFNKVTSKLDSYWMEEEDPFKQYGVYEIINDISDKDILWVGVNIKGLVRFNKKTYEFTVMNCDLPTPYQDKDGIFWSGTWDKGLAKYDPKQNICNYTRINSQFPEESQSANLHSFKVSKIRNNKWLGTSYGLLEIDENENLERLFYDKKNDHVLTFYKDFSNNIWIGTFGGTIKIFKPNKQHIRFHSLDSFEPTTRYYPSYQIYDAYNNRFLTAAGFRHKLYLIQNDKDQTKLNNTINTDFAISGFAKGPEQEIWVANSQELYRIDKHSNKLIQLSLPILEKAGLAEIGIWQIGNDISGNICILGEHGFIYYDLKKDQAYPCLWNSNDKLKLDSEFVWDFNSDSQGNIWMCTNNHLFRFNPTENIITNFDKPIDKPYLNYRSATLGPKGKLWSVGNTLELFDVVGDSLYHIEDNYLPTKLQGIGGTKIHLDSHDRIWVFSQNGMHAFDPETYEYYRFDNNDGLENTYLDPQQCINLSDGTILTHGGSGIMVFDPDSLWDSKSKIKDNVRINSIKVSGREYQSDLDYNHLSSIDISSFDSYVEIQFNAIAFPKSYERDYSYRIRELSEEWIYHGKNQTVTLTNLPPGKYGFQVKVGHPNSMAPIKNLDILIPKAYYQEWWFILTITVLLLSTIFGIYLMRIKRIRREEELKTEFNMKIAEVELQALRAQMNPHFMFNTLNSIKSYILKAGPLEAAEYLTNFAGLIRSILNNSREKQISLQKEIEALLLYIDLEKMRFPEQFDFIYTVSEDIPLEEILIPPLILQPYVENAIWHGLLHKMTKGNLMISLHKEGNKVICHIQDDGIGRQQSMELMNKSVKKYKSMGMGITQDRIEIHNKMNDLGISVQIVDNKDEDNLPTGTSVYITFPLNFQS